MALKHKKSRDIALMLSVVAIVAALSGYWGWRILQENPKHHASSQTISLKPAPEFELPDSLGHKKKLEEFRGSFVILHFWASWCPPCLDEIPQWVELGNAFRDRNVKLVAISQDQNWEDAQKILPTSKLSGNITSLLDVSTEVSDRYGTYQFPETYLINPDLKIVMKWVGPQDWGSQEIHQFIQRFIPKT